MRVLVVEDDPIIADGLREGLTLKGLAIDTVGNLESALLGIQSQDYGMLILDLGLPDGNGQELIKKLRSQNRSIPILVLTARDGIPDRIESLDLGADDYMTKPFDLNELAARIRALMRRSQGRAAPVLKYKCITLDPSSHEIYNNGIQIDLSAKEFSILQLFLEKIGKVLTREFLEEQLYAWDKEVESNAVEVHIHHLRKKLGNDLIKNIRGVGYVVPKESP